MPSTSVSPLWRVTREALFQVDAERIHEAALVAMNARSKFGRCEPKQKMPVNVAGIEFPNPLGVAAGLDKNGVAVPALAGLGFGFVEVGTVTWHPQPGNARPRLFRLQDDQAILNRMGFNNKGARALADQLAHWRNLGRIQVPVGVNLGKSKITPNDEAALDYKRSFSATADVADYMVVNISSPNTPGLRDLQTRDEVLRILNAVGDENEKRQTPRPLFLKLAPDLNDDDARVCAEATIESGAQGLIVSNTTVSRDGLLSVVPEGGGGISGRPLKTRSTELLRALTKEFSDDLAFIGVGGVFDANDAQQKLDAGADLVQSYTGFIYQGPTFAKRVVGELRKHTPS
ncbi:MAG: quinone-dependent dihydroorotate dehydrogenase [Deltaproteobacteria bacterium]|nr:quinone-dependent dihydroorotate dehydrogenase [Deltaproteobacteria bacterium]